MTSEQSAARARAPVPTLRDRYQRFRDTVFSSEPRETDIGVRRTTYLCAAWPPIGALPLPVNPDPRSVERHNWRIAIAQNSLMQVQGPPVPYAYLSAQHNENAKYVHINCAYDAPYCAIPYGLCEKGTAVQYFS